MKKKKEIIKSAAYWLAHLQVELFQQLKIYMKKNHLNQNDLADKLKVTKGHISQILNGDSNFTLKKLINLSLSIGKVPVIKFVSERNYIPNEKRIEKFFEQIEYPSFEDLHTTTFEALQNNKLDLIGFRTNDFDYPFQSYTVTKSVNTIN